MQRGPKNKGAVLELWAGEESGRQMALGLTIIVFVDGYYTWMTNILSLNQGYAHAVDRMVPMVLSRIISQGRVSELIVGEDSKALAIDTFMRKQVALISLRSCLLASFLNSSYL